MLPAPTQNTEGVGSKATRAKVRNALWLSHFRDTGLDINSGRAPKGGDLTWARTEIERQDNKKDLLAGLVQKRAVQELIKKKVGRELEVP